MYQGNMFQSHFGDNLNKSVSLQSKFPGARSEASSSLGLAVCAECLVFLHLLLASWGKGSLFLVCFFDPLHQSHTNMDEFGALLKRKESLINYISN